MLEFGEHKSAANLAKHGIDFVEAHQLWDDADLLEIPARITDEPRYLLVGKIQGRLWSAVVTHRNGRTRIISVRRSRQEEVKLYES